MEREGDELWRDARRREIARHPEEEWLRIEDRLDATRRSVQVFAAIGPGAQSRPVIDRIEAALGGCLDDPRGMMRRVARPVRSR